MQSADSHLLSGLPNTETCQGSCGLAADARAVSQSLTEIGFDVDLVLEPDGRGVDEAAERFTSSLREGDIALFYFAGHAARIQREFTLLPADAPPLGTRAEEGERAFGLALTALV